MISQLTKAYKYYKASRILTLPLNIQDLNMLTTLPVDILETTSGRPSIGALLLHKISSVSLFINDFERFFYQSTLSNMLSREGSWHLTG